MAITVPFNTNIAFKRGNTSKNNTYTGNDGTISIDTEAGDLRYHDGTTTGGNIAGLKRTYSRHNLLYNGGFENGLDGWSVSGGTWGAYYHSRFGTVCVCTNISSITGSVTLESEFIECAPNTPYVIAGDSAFTGTGSVYFDVVFYNGNKVSLIDGNQSAIINSHDYSDTGRYKHAVLNVSSNDTRFMKVRAVAEGISAGATYLGFRHIKLEQGYLPNTPYTNEETIKRLTSKVNGITGPNITSAFNYKGSWNPSTNVPSIPVASSDNKNWYYKASASGTNNVTGSGITYSAGDWIISDGIKWNYLSGTDVANAQASVLNALATASESIKVENVETTLKSYVDSLYTSMRGFPVYISETQPTASGPYLWIQKFSNGNITFWIEDGL